VFIGLTGIDRNQADPLQPIGDAPFGARLPALPDRRVWRSIHWFSAGGPIMMPLEDEPPASSTARGPGANLR